MRQLPPRTTGAHDIHYGIDHLAHVVSTRATAPFGFRNQRIDQSPLTVRQIGGVWLPFHTTSSASRPLLKQVLRLLCLLVSMSVYAGCVSTTTQAGNRDIVYGRFPEAEEEVRATMRKIHQDAVTGNVGALPVTAS